MAVNNLIVQFFAMTAVVILAAGSADAGRPLSCDRIQEVPLDSLLRNGILDSGECLYLSEGRLCSNPDCEPTICDWEYSAEETASVQPEPGAFVRIVSGFMNHVGGSGAWAIVAAFECRDGSMREVFRKHWLYGAKVDLVSDSAFSLRGGVWVKGDAMCCPSFQKRVVYRWNAAERNFRATEVQYFRGGSWQEPGVAAPKPDGERNYGPLEGAP